MSISASGMDLAAHTSQRVISRSTPWAVGILRNIFKYLSDIRSILIPVNHCTGLRDLLGGTAYGTSNLANLVLHFGHGTATATAVAASKAIYLAGLCGGATAGHLLMGLLMLLHVLL